MFLDVYLGSIDDPALELDSDGLPRGIPYRVGPLFPGSRSRVFYMVREAIGTGELKGREVECAAWVAVVTKGELERFLAKAYPNPPLPQMALLPEYDDIPGLWAFVAQLAPDKKYALAGSSLDPVRAALSISFQPTEEPAVNVPTVEDAIAFAVEKHSGKRDKGDQPYILHPLRVMLAQNADEGPPGGRASRRVRGLRRQHRRSASAGLP